LRAAGSTAEFHYNVWHRSLEPATDSRLCAIMDGLPPMSPFDRGGE
jgi:hypothetical protein